MSLHRTMKKTVYAVGFFIVLFGFFALIIIPFLPRKNTSSNITNTGSSNVPVVVESVVVVPHIAFPGPKGKTIDIVARLRNENPRAGTGDYVMTFVVKDSNGEVITTSKHEAYVLPGGLQYVTALDVPIPADREFGKVEVQVPSSVSLATLPQDAKLPVFSVFLRDRTFVTSTSYPLEQQTGIVTNKSTFDWEKVEVNAIALDAKGNIVGVGNTFVGKLLIGEQREFTLQWPVPHPPAARVLAIATTNIYSDENIVHIIGDPSRLR